MKSNTTRLLVRNVFHLGIGQVASTALGVALAAVLGRALGPTDFGILYAISAICTFVYVGIDWGQGTYLVREMARGRDDEAGIIGSAILFRLATTVAASAVAVAVAMALGYSREIIELTLLAVIVGIPATIYAPFGFKFRGKDRMDIDAFANIGNKATTLAGTALALHLGGGLLYVILMQGLGGIFALIVGVLFALRLGFKVAVPSRKNFSELFRQGTPIAAFSLVVAWQPFVETMMLSAFAGPAVVGWYGASRTILGIINSPAMITLTAFFPELSRASLSLPDFRRMIDISARVLFLAAAFTSSALYVFSDLIVATIYGSRHFEQAAAILRVNAIFVPLLFFSVLLASAMTAVGRNSMMVAISIVRIAFCSIMGWVLLGFWQQHYGNAAIILVIIAGVAEIPLVIACLFLLPKGAVGKTTILNLARAYFVSVCTVLPFWFLGPLKIWYLAPLFMLIFAVVALATRLIGQADLVLALDMVRNGLSAFRGAKTPITPASGA